MVNIIDLALAQQASDDIPLVSLLGVNGNDEVAQLTFNPANTLLHTVSGELTLFDVSSFAGHTISVVNGAIMAVAYTQQSAKGHGAIGDGVAIENVAIAELLSSSRELYIDNGVYKVSPEINITEQDYHIVVDPRASFITNALDFGPIVKAIGANPVLAFDAFYKDVTTNYDLYEHIVGKSIFMKGDTAGVVVVSLYSNAEGAVNGASVFGANFGVYLTSAGAVGVGLEIDVNSTVAGATGTALALDAVGSAPAQTAIVIQNNNSASPFNYGISFNNANAPGTIVHNAIQFTGSGTAERFLYAPADMLFTTAEIELPSFIVGPTVAEIGSNAKIRVDANAAGSPLISAVGSAGAAAIRYRTKSTADHIFQGGDSLSRLVVKGTVGATYLQVTAGSGGVTVQPNGTDTNADVVLLGKGNAGVHMLGASGGSKFRVDDTGVGFFGHARAGQQSSPAALSTGGAETNTNICTAVNAIRTALLNTGYAA